MGIGLGLGVGLRASPRPRGWSPASALSDILITLDVPTAIARGGLLFQDSGSTTPATADGHLVYVAVCPWTGNSFKATGNATRPILRTVDGTWFLQGTGTQFLDMDPRIETTYTPGAVVAGFRAANGNGLFSTSVDGATDGSLQACRFASNAVSIWPGSLNVAVTESGVSITDSLTAEFSSSAGTNFLSVRLNGASILNGSEAVVVDPAGMRCPSVLTGGNSSGAFLTGYARRILFFKAAMSSATRTAAEAWVKN